MSIEIILGPMFAGKTSSLLNKIAVTGEPYEVVKFAGDSRYSDSCVVSHDGKQHSATSVRLLAEFTPRNDTKYVFIDEGQFYQDLAPATTLLKKANIHVFIAALDFTYENKWFKPILDIMRFADKVTRITAKCDCGQPATQTKLLTNDQADGDDILIGGSDKYIPTCINCYSKNT